MTERAAAERALAPAYGERSLADLIPAVAAALGVPLGEAGAEGTGLDLPAAPSYVVFLVDGLGARLLERHAEAAPFLASLRTQAATCAVPSTTATSLASLGTGLPPGTHGLVGYTARVPGSGDLLNHLSWAASVDPREWQPHPTAFGRIAARGVGVTVINRRQFRDSGLTVAAQRGSDYVGADKVGERLAAAQAAAAGAPSLTYLYDNDLDWTGHRYGVASAEWRQQLSMIDAEAERLRDALPSHARLLITGDHGMIDSPETARVDVDEVDGLREGVTLLGGEARFRHLYCRPGAVAEVHAHWSRELGDRALVVTREEATDRGWFGTVDAAVRARLGDVMVAALDDLAVMSRHDFPHESGLVGLHGSLSPDEMTIPILLG